LDSGGALDLTFALQARGQPGSEYQIRSTSAADLKSLRCNRQIRSGTSNRKAALVCLFLLVPIALPNFA
jgi:hypothetical protein